MKIIKTVGQSAMYTKAKKVLGYWSIMLESSPDGQVQFKSLSRRAATLWREANEPLPASYQLNSTVAPVWRERKFNEPL